MINTNHKFRFFLFKLYFLNLLIFSLCQQVKANHSGYLSNSYRNKKNNNYINGLVLNFPYFVKRRIHGPYLWR